MSAYELIVVKVENTDHVRNIVSEDKRALEYAPHREMCDYTMCEQNTPYSDIAKIVPYSSNVIPPFPTSSMSRSFQRPGPAFWPTGAAKSMILAIAQSGCRSSVVRRENDTKRTYGTRAACSRWLTYRGSGRRNDRNSVRLFVS